MMTPDFPGFSIGPGARSFNPRPVPEGHKRALARCPVKGCDYCKAFDVPTVERRFAGRFASQGNVTICKVADASALMRISNEEHCPTHPRHMLTVRLVEGKLSEAHKCDPRCTSATGHKCDCSCAGANHGADWL